MGLVSWQVLTVLTGIVFVGSVLLSIVKEKNFSRRESLRYGHGTDQGEIVWMLKATRIGSGEKTWFQKIIGKHVLKGSIALEEDQYWMGNRIQDELYVDAAGCRVKLYLNVQRDSVYLSVLEGEVMIQNQVYGPDKTSRILIRNNDTVLFEDLELQFLKTDIERGWEE